MNFIVQQLVKYGNTKSDAIKMTRKHYNHVIKRYRNSHFIPPVKKAEIISSLSANESVNEGQKKFASKIVDKFDQAYLKFSREVRDVIKMMDRSTGDKTDGKIIDKAYSKGLIPLDKLMQEWGRGQQENPHIDESVNERRQYRSGGQEMNFIVQQLVKLGNTKSDAIKMTRKHYNDVLKRYKEPWFVHPIKKAEIISSLSANESINEAPGKSGKDQYVGQARVKVEPYTYKNQKRDFHDVSMYRDHKKPYNYYLSIRLAHSNKIDMVVDTGTHIQSKAGKWAQGFIKRRMNGTGKERFE